MGEARLERVGLATLHCKEGKYRHCDVPEAPMRADVLSEEHPRYPAPTPDIGAPLSRYPSSKALPTRFVPPRVFRIAAVFRRRCRVSCPQSVRNPVPVWHRLGFEWGESMPELEPKDYERVALS